MSSTRNVALPPTQQVQNRLEKGQADLKRGSAGYGWLDPKLVKSFGIYFCNVQDAVKVRGLVVTEPNKNVFVTAELSKTKKGFNNQTCWRLCNGARA